MRNVFVKLGASLLASLAAFPAAAQDDGQFKDYEIRVIRQKYFQKRFRVALGLNGGAIMNQSFIYTYQGGGDLSFHFTEWIGLFGEGQFGFTANKGDCDTLGKTFKIGPVVNQINWIAGGGVVLTPIYGKYQLSNGDVTYFDWFFTVGGGVANVLTTEKNCLDNGKEDPPERQLTQFNFGTGQRYFLTKNIAAIWQLRDIVTNDPDNKESSLASNILLSLGIGFYF